MIIRAIDSSGDWTFGKGRNDYKSGVAAVTQLVDTRINSYLGDCFFATSDGIDWFNLLGGKNQLAIQIAISAVILNTPNVVSILSLSVNLDEITRNLVINYSILVNAVTPTQASSNVVVAPGDLLTTESGETLTTESGEGLETEN